MAPTRSILPNRKVVTTVTSRSKPSIKHCIAQGMIRQSPDYGEAFKKGVIAAVLAYHIEVVKPLEKRIEELEKRLNAEG